MEIKQGIYKHYKGELYAVIDVAKHTETNEELVVYRQLHGDIGRIWVRPKLMFLEELEMDGRKVPRFKKVDLGTEVEVTELSRVKTFEEYSKLLYEFYRKTTRRSTEIII